MKAILLISIVTLISCNCSDCDLPLGTRVKVKYINKEGTIVRKTACQSYQIQYDNGIHEERGLACDRLTVITPLTNNN